MFVFLICFQTEISNFKSQFQKYSKNIFFSFLIKHPHPKLDFDLEIFQVYTELAGGTLVSAEMAGGIAIAVHSEAETKVQPPTLR